MDMFLKGAAVALALAGTSLVTAGTATADRYNDGRDRSGSTVTIGFGNVAYGYRDGYWDTRHHWHHWKHNRDNRSYRDQNGSNYHDMNHNRENNNGWQPH